MPDKRQSPANGPDEPPAPVAKAIEDLSLRLGISRAEIQVESVKEVTWPDTSLGCAVPDMVYAQVLTPGYRVALQAGGETYEYHTDLNDLVKPCSGEGMPEFPADPAEIDDGIPWMPVD